MSKVRFPSDLTLEPLRKPYRCAAFTCGRPRVDEWLARYALQQQKKHLSVTKVLVDEAGNIAGFYTLATGQVDFGNLPHAIRKTLPRQALPVAILAWLGVAVAFQGHGLGSRLLASALGDCYLASTTFAFVAVILDALDDAAKRYYQKWDFEDLPGHHYRLYLSTRKLESMMEEAT